VRDGDQLDAVVDHALEGLHVERAGIVARRHVDDGAGAPRHLQEGDVVAGILRARGEDTVAGCEADGIERHVPRHGGVLDQGDLVAAAVDQACDRVVDRRVGFASGVRRFISAERCLPLQVANLGPEDRRRHERGAGVVEMHDRRRRGRVAAGPRYVDRHPRLRRVVFGILLGPFVRGGIVARIRQCWDRRAYNDGAPPAPAKPAVAARSPGTSSEAAPAPT
jgi:hypothetical protein